MNFIKTKTKTRMKIKYKCSNSRTVASEWTIDLFDAKISVYQIPHEYVMERDAVFFRKLFILII